MENVNAIKLAITAFFAAMTALFGWFGWLAIIFIFCMAVDYLTGSAVAARGGDWSSKEARSGLWRKGGSILVVLVAVLFDVLIGLVVNNVIALHLPFEYDVVLGPIVLAWYIVTEIGSIIENAGSLGAPVPKFLQSAIKIFKASVTAAGDKLVPGEDEEE